MKKIAVSDFTLVNLAVTGKELLFREKTSVAACIDRIGADKAELPPIVREKEDAIINKTIASVVKNCTLAIRAGSTENSIDTAWECIKTAEKPCLQIALPVSTAQMEYSFRAKEAKMIEMITKLVSYAKQKCDNVEFIAIDATRADKEFLINACNTAKENGAVCITLCDDAGVSLPEEIAEIVKEVKAACDLPLYVCLTDKISMAVAGSFAAIKAGADGVKTSMTGDDVLHTGKFADAVNAKGTDLGIETALKMTEINSDIAGITKKLVYGDEAYKKNIVTETTADIFLDGTSTIADVSKAIELMGYKLSDEDNGKVHKALMQVCERKSSVGAKELEALIASNAAQAPATYHLMSFAATCSDKGASMAQVTLGIGDKNMSGVATGDGPIDSAFRAIENCLGFHYELDAFQLEAVTEGKEALGSALVRLRNQGKLYSGNGLSTDIVGATVRAYINALNKIVYEENQI